MSRTNRSLNSLIYLLAICLIASIALARAVPAQADANTTPWAAPVPIATGLPEAARPSIITAADGLEHAAWESEGQIYHAVKTADQGWGAPERIATGIAPVMLTDSLGQLHILFANQFLGNYEIYDASLTRSTWSLPVNVSHTSGVSMFPAAAAGRDGVLYVAWMDNSPGYWTIYVGTWNGRYWSNRPVPNARGQAPALAVAPDGTPYLAWQDRVPSASNPAGVYEIYVSERHGTSWSLPINVSDRESSDSIGVDLATTPDGLAHLTWVDGDQEVRYCLGQDSYWPYPVTVARAATAARGPRILAERGARIHIAWDEGDMVRAVSAAMGTTAWPKPAVISAPFGDLHDVALSLGANHGISLSWAQTNQPLDTWIYRSWRPSDLTDRAWLPLLLR